MKHLAAFAMLLAACSAAPQSGPPTMPQDAPDAAQAPEDASPAEDAAAPDVDAGMTIDSGHPADAGHDAGNACAATCIPGTSTGGTMVYGGTCGIVGSCDCGACVNPNESCGDNGRPNLCGQQCGDFYARECMTWNQNHPNPAEQVPEAHGYRSPCHTFPNGGTGCKGMMLGPSPSDSYMCCP
ncbi:MAG: hypothetical protein PVSMB8_13160 [Vulcanimicrobiaceae bacterium]